MINVVKDAEGVRMALEEIFEEDYVRSRIGRELENAAQQTRERMERMVPPRTLSPGYYSFASHLLWLEDERSAGCGFTAGALAAYEVRGLVALSRARAAFDRRHPKCSSCGARQQNCFSTECLNCGIKFRRKGQ